jgi:hypothetical protein
MVVLLLVKGKVARTGRLVLSDAGSEAGRPARKFVNALRGADIHEIALGIVLQGPDRLAIGAALSQWVGYRGDRGGENAEEIGAWGRFIPDRVVCADVGQSSSPDEVRNESSHQAPAFLASYV